MGHPGEGHITYKNPVDMKEEQEPIGVTPKQEKNLLMIKNYGGQDEKTQQKSPSTKPSKYNSHDLKKNNSMRIYSLK